MSARLPLLLCLILSTACGQPEKAVQVTTDADAGNAGVQPDASTADVAEPEDSCETCDRPSCWRECGEPDLEDPTESTCDVTPSFDDGFRLLMHLDPANLPNNLDFQGGCTAMLSAAADYTVSFIAPRDGEFLVGLEKLRGDGQFELVSGVPSASPSRVCENFSDAQCSVNAGQDYRVAPREVIAGQEYFYTVEIDAPGDFYLGGNYNILPIARGEACEEGAFCSGVAACTDGVCACLTGALPGVGTNPDGDIIETCGCEAGFEANDDRTACVEVIDRCDPDPCPTGERCSVTGGEAVCTPSLARVGESCTDAENPCEAGLLCKFIPCPFTTGGRMCVTPCSSASTCNEANIACGRRNDTQQPSCEATSTASEPYCTWSG